VIRRHVLAALAAGVEAGDDNAARERVRHADWVLRGSAKRQLERALIDATLLTGEHGAADPESMRHVQRVAALTVAGCVDVDAHDRWRVAAAYATLPTSATSVPIATILVSSIVALVTIALVVFSLRTPHRPARAPTPLVSGAFFYGGTPARDAELERFLVDELTTLVIETDADRRQASDAPAAPSSSRQEHAVALRDAKVIAAHGPGLLRAWRDLIDALDRWSALPIGSRRGRQAAAELGRRAQEVSDQFAALGLGYYIQADTIVRRYAHAALFVYRVEEVVFVRAGGQAHRLLGLRRLDRLNMTHAMLGRQNEELGDPVLLLDQIDAFVTDKVMPTLAGSSYAVGDTRTLSFLAGEAIRRELATALGDDATRERVTRIVAASVRRHEARHAIDIDREKPLRYPKALAAYVGPMPSDDASKRFVLRARAELAAYTSQIGNDPIAPQLALWNLASAAFNRERWGSAESYVAVVIIEGLARQIGVTSPRPVVLQGRLDTSRLAALAEPLAAQSTETLRMAARKLWIELYGEPMLPIVDLLR